MIRQTALVPSKAVEQNRMVRASLGLDGQNPLMDAAGIHFSPNPLEVKGRLLPPPELEFGRGQKERIRMPDATWKGPMPGQYLVPTRCEKWAAIALSNDQYRIFPNEFR
jgi:hypothetical protein